MEKDVFLTIRLSEAERDTMGRLAKSERGIEGNKSKLLRRWIKDHAKEKGMRIQRDKRVAENERDS